ncbi:putative cardiolipin synthase [Oxalobacteraceae bacterium GrIS 2.11]
MLTKFVHSFVILLALCLGGCSTFPPGANYPRTASTAMAHPENTQLAQTFSAAANANTGKSGFRVIQVGADGFLMRMQMIKAAEKTIDLQYYIFHGDNTGRLLTAAILSAADRGVRVRILIDDGETENGDEQIALIEAHPSIEIRIFNPFAYRGHVQFFRAGEYLLNNSRLDYRMHNKMLVIDNSIALIGGRNIGDQYFQVDPDSQFADDDLFSTGPITHQMSGIFDEFWNNSRSIPSKALDSAPHNATELVDHRHELNEERVQMKADGIDYVKRITSGEPFQGIVSGRLPLVWAHAQLVSDSPDKKQVEDGSMVGKLMHIDVAKATSGVQSELLMVTPYFIPGKVGMKLFQDLRQRDVHIRILTNSLESSTESLAQAGYMPYRKPLLEQGVELYEICSLLKNNKGSGQTAKMSSHGNFSLHGKLFVMDRQRLFIGSMNFDQRSMHLNTEIGLIVDSPELAQQVAVRFEAMVQPGNAYHVTLDPDSKRLIWHTEINGLAVDTDVEPARSDWQRFKTQFLSHLPLDSEL